MKKVFFACIAFMGFMGTVAAQTEQKVSFKAPVIKKNAAPTTETVQFTPPKIVKNKRIVKRKTYSVKRKHSSKAKTNVRLKAPVQMLTEEGNRGR